MTGAKAAIMATIHSPVVVGFDFSQAGSAALRRALTLAKRAPFHVLHVICVAEPHQSFAALPARHIDYPYTERVQAAAEREIESELRLIAPTPHIQYFVHARIGRAATEILALAKEVGADLIIVGNKGSRGLERALLGSVSEQVVREAGCTVEVARPKTYDEIELVEIREVKPSGHYVPPHRYSYEDNRAVLRPIDWPLP